MSIKEYEDFLKRRGGEKEEVEVKETKNKYGAISTYVDGFRFDSKIEATYYRVIKRMIELKIIRYVLRQVPFHLPGRTKLLIDFMLVYPDGTIVYVDVKGYKPTEAWNIKRKLVETFYPVTITIIKRKQIYELVRRYGVSLGD